MNRNELSCRELLAEAGVTTQSSRGEIPSEHRHLLIASVLECISAQNLRHVLRKHGVRETLRIVSEWQSKTRDWLGLPPARPGKPSAQYLREIEEWKEQNGDPSWEEIDSGWVPARHRGKENSAPRRLASKYQSQIEEFRRQVAALDAAENDDDVRRLLTQYMTEMGRASQIPGLVTEFQQAAEEEICIQNEASPIETSSGSAPSPDESSSEMKQSED